MKTRIIKLTESDLYRIVKRVINEQETGPELEDKSYFSLGRALAFKIVDGVLYSVKFNENGDPKLDENLNGTLSEFKVDYNTGEVIGNEFNNNVKLVEANWSEIQRAGAAPSQTAYEYKFIAIVPEDAPSKNAPIGAPIVYTATISAAPGKNYFKSKPNYTESKTGEVGEKTYYKKGGVEYYLRLSSGPYAMEYVSGESPIETPVGKPFELNIESPFEFDSIRLTSEAQTEFNNFIESVKKNYSNVEGDVEVICSASIDGAPDQKRIDYDMNLSKKRAQTIVSILKNSLPGTKLNFIPKGIGQTEQFAPGKKYPEVRDKNATAPNRRLIIKLPKITT